MPVTENPYINAVTETYRLFHERKPNFRFPKDKNPSDSPSFTLKAFMESYVKAWSQDMHHGVLILSKVGVLNQAVAEVLSLYARNQAISAHLPYYPDLSLAQDEKAASFLCTQIPTLDQGKIAPLCDLLRQTGGRWGARFMVSPAYADSLAGMVNQNMFEINRLFGQSFKTERSAEAILELVLA